MEMKKICFVLLVVAMVATTIHAESTVEAAHADAPAHAKANAHAPTHAEADAHAPTHAQMQLLRHLEQLQQQWLTDQEELLLLVLLVLVARSPWPPMLVFLGLPSSR
ncbi:hypothetical protein H6P81_014210 [Aristolochia fimbriata]|uniref:Uncharacterized protein n=1 Tax=Aristolochia fimbriata TaxID=158543 RepID=A0AAV7EK62_ARIFI|nr:hypothetical protein H6P81_014210 [Aristolochia fimbriata]